MSFTTWIAGAALLLAAVATGAASAQVVDDPCKNHYILSDNGTKFENTKCQVEAPADDVAPPPPSSPPPPPPVGDGPSLRITQVYSSMDGSTQYVELTEIAGRNDQQRIAGLTLASTANGFTKTFVFPHDLPSSQTAYGSYVVAVSDRTDASTGLPVLFHMTGCCVGFRVADFAMPERFLAVRGGTLTFAGVDTWTYAALPTDGNTALYRDGSAGPAILKGALHCPTPTGDLCVTDIAVTAPLVDALEFRNVFDDRRYVTATADDIDAIDEGRNPGWVRTGMELAVGTSVDTYLGVEYTYVGSAVCRYRIPTRDGVGYFYSLKQDECDAAAREPGAVLETPAAFYAQSPDWAAGTCAPLPGFIDGDIPLTPVYRLSSPLSAFDTRLTTDTTVRDALVAAGWQRSGFGPEGTALCVY